MGHPRTDRPQEPGTRDKTTTTSNTANTNINIHIKRVKDGTHSNNIDIHTNNNNTEGSTTSGIQRRRYTNIEQAPPLLPLRQTSEDGCALALRPGSHLLLLLLLRLLLRLLRIKERVS